MAILALVASGVMLWVDEALYRAAIGLWLRRDAPEPLSVTDAVSFEVMRAREPEAFLYLGDTAYTDQGRPRATTR